MKKAARQVLETLKASGPLWTASQVLDRAGLHTQERWPVRTVSLETLKGQVQALLSAWGMPEAHIPVTVEHLVYADLHGIDSHGVGMLVHYHRALQAGTLTMTPDIQVIREGGGTVLIDGGGGLGHVPGDMAMRRAMAVCRQSGVAAVAVRNSGHYGAAGTYAALAAREGLLGMAMTTGLQPAVVPTFGKEAVLGTNPIAFAAPAARNRPFLLDMATSTVPIGKLWTAWRSGRAIPEGWALDPTGAPATDGKVAAEHRRLTPLGGTPEMSSHKGYGLGAMVHILCALLSGETDGKVGHFFLALDPSRFGEPAQFAGEMDRFLDGLRASRPADAAQPVITHGDPEYAAREERLKQGIPLTRSVVEDIRLVCRSSGAPFLLDESP